MSRVLIVDDDAIIRQAAGRGLGRLGHDVQYAAHGEEAIALYRQAYESQRGFDVVILDLAMGGGMRGQEVLAHLRSIDAHVKAIVSSGYTQDPIVVEYARHGFRAALAKPYRMQDVVAALHQALGEG